MGLTSRLAALVEAIDPRVQQRTRRRVDEVRDTARELRRALDLVDIRTQQLMLIERLNWEQRGQMAAIVAVLDREHVRAHVMKAIADAPLSTDPFPHLVVERWLPEALFAALVKAIPPPVFFAEKPAHKQQLSIPPPIAPESSRRVWEFVAEVVAAECVGPAVVQKLETHIDAYVRAICPAGEAWRGHLPMHVSDGRLLVRRPGYLLEPHRDPRWGFVTCLAYLNQVGGGELYGTRLYRVRNDVEAPDESVHYVEKADCDLVRTIPPHANTLLVFLNSAGAHGASIPTDAPADLERFVYQFRIGPDMKGIRWLLDRMPESRRTLWAGFKTGTRRVLIGTLTGSVPSLSELLRDLVAILPGGRRLKAEYDHCDRQRALLRKQLDEARERIHAYQSDPPEMFGALLPLRHAALLSSDQRAARQFEDAFAARSPSYRDAMALPPPSARKRIDGVSWYVPDDSDGRFAAADLELPLEEIAHARQLATGPVMLDIGANIGTTAIPRVIVGDFARVYALEPDPANYACLVHNVLALGVRGRVLPDATAIGDREGEIALQQGHSGTHHLVAGAVPAQKRAITVRCLPLDAWVAQMGIDPADVHFVKSDTQGWDAHVLAGAAGVLAHRHIVWQVEFSPSMLRRAGCSAAQMRDLVQAHFTHFIDPRGEHGPRSRPVSELAAALGYVESGRRSYTNLLLYNT